MKNKKPLIALFVLLLIGLVGGTFAFFTSTKTFDNVFKISNGGYNVTIEEDFTPPDPWLPGQEVSKDVYVTNTGNVNIVARAKYTEIWSKTSLTGKLADGSSVAQINFTSGSHWKLHTDGYYYYTSVISKGTKTDSFIDSVTLNPDLELDSEYIGADYTLRITVETIQADGAADEWGITSSLVSGL